MQHLPLGTNLQSGAYTTGKVLGQGGFGIVYACDDTRLQRLVAIKEFFPQGCVRQGGMVVTGGAIPDVTYNQTKAKFLSEARELARFDDDGIVKVFTTFEENGTAYMVMEHLQGVTLQQWVESHGAMPVRDAVKCAKSVGRVLHMVHETGRIHRDITPHNIMLCASNRAVLVDFGLARQLEEASNYTTRRLTQTTRLGTGGYAPIEQYGSMPTGRSTDVYALAATLYFLLTGHPPTEAPDRVAGKELTLPYLLNPQVSFAVGEAVMEALALQHNQRPSSIPDFIATLNQAVSSPPPIAIPTPQPQPTTDAHQTVAQGGTALGTLVGKGAGGLYVMFHWLIGGRKGPAALMHGASARTGILRISRPSKLNGMLHAVSLSLDGRRIGEVKNGHILEIEVPNGVHELKAKLDICRRDKFRFQLQADEELEVDVVLSGLSLQIRPF